MKPNIVWLMTDEQRTDSLGCYGSDWALSPYLDRYARDGVVFQQAVTPAPVCQPARDALLSGQYPSVNGVWYNQGKSFKQPVKHLVRHFAEAGYRTASFGKNHYDHTAGTAFETEQQRIIGPYVNWSGYAEQYDEREFGAVHYPPEPYPWIFGGTFPERMELTVEADVVRLASRWLEEHPAGKPFFLRLSFNAPHTPVIPPYPFDRLIPADNIAFPPETEGASAGSPKWISETLRAFSDAARLSDGQIREARRFYYGETAYADYQFGVMLDWMRERGFLDNTIVVYVSDHGTHIGDYGLVQKQTFYNPVVHVPFFFWGPGTIRQGKRIETPVETLSLLPTLLELAGLDIPDECDGISVAHTLRSGAEPPARPVFSEFTLGSFDTRHRDRLVMVQDGSWKMSVCMDPHIHDGALFDLRSDPHERRNLYEEAPYRPVVERLTALILHHLNR